MVAATNQEHAERAAEPAFASDLDSPAMKFDELHREREAYARARRDGISSTIETLEDVRQVSAIDS